MAVRTVITAQYVVNALNKWGIPHDAPYPGWATHNRNHKGNWGPILGVMVHNFASNIADASSDRYLHDGDQARGMPGPLSQLSLRDNGTVGLIGWGRANHGGRGEPRVIDTVRRDAMPRNTELRPTSFGTADMNAGFIGIEMLYGGNKATRAQREGIVILCAALLDMLGAGYTGGSVTAHREATNTRSDPEGMSMASMRTQIDAALRAGPPVADKPPVKPPLPKPQLPPKEWDEMATEAQVRDAVREEVTRATAGLLNKADGDTLRKDIGYARDQIRADSAWQNEQAAKRAALTTEAIGLIQSVAAREGATADDVRGAVEKALSDLASAEAKISINLPGADAKKDSA